MNKNTLYSIYNEEKYYSWFSESKSGDFVVIDESNKEYIIYISSTYPFKRPVITENLPKEIYQIKQRTKNINYKLKETSFQYFPKEFSSKEELVEFCENNNLYYDTFVQNYDASIEAEETRIKENIDFVFLGEHRPYPENIFFDYKILATPKNIPAGLEYYNRCRLIPNSILSILKNHIYLKYGKNIKNLFTNESTGVITVYGNNNNRSCLEIKIPSIEGDNIFVLVEKVNSFLEEKKKIIEKYFSYIPCPRCSGTGVISDLDDYDEKINNIKKYILKNMQRKEYKSNKVIKEILDDLYNYFFVINT